MVYEFLLAGVSTLAFLVALYFSFRLSRETRGEKYWVFFFIAAVGFLVGHLASKGFLGLEGSALFVLAEGGEIVGALSLAYATYGLYAAMCRIRREMAREFGA